jgi:hypothetical protein
MSLNISATGISVTSGGVTRFDTSSKYPVILTKLYFPDGWAHSIDFSVASSTRYLVHITPASYHDNTRIIARKGEFYDAHPDFCFAYATMRSPYGSRKVFINGGIPLDALAGAVDRSGTNTPIYLGRYAAAGSVLGAFLQFYIDGNGNLVERVRTLTASYLSAGTTGGGDLYSLYEGTQHMIAHSKFLYQVSEDVQRREFTVDLSDIQVYVGKFIG